MTITRSEFVKGIADVTGLSIPEAARKVTEACAEMEIQGTSRTALSERQAGELEAIIVRDVKAGK